MVNAVNYGIPTLMEFPEAESLARFCADSGFQFMEMNMTFPWFQSGRITARALRSLQQTYGIGLTLHLHDQVNPFEFSPEMRRGSFENVRFALDLACELSIPRLTMHLLPGTYSSINGKKTYLYQQCMDHYLDLVCAFRDEVQARLRGQSTLFCIENTSGFRPFHQAAIERLLEADRFGLTFDIGHNFKAGGNDESFLLAHDGRLSHFHIHDCSLVSNHLGFGAGGLDVLRYLEMARSYGCSVVAEVKESGALLQSRAYLQAHHLW